MTLTKREFLQSAGVTAVSAAMAAQADPLRKTKFFLVKAIRNRTGCPRPRGRSIS